MDVSCETNKRISSWMVIGTADWIGSNFVKSLLKNRGIFCLRLVGGLTTIDHHHWPPFDHWNIIINEIWWKYDQEGFNKIRSYSVGCSNNHSRRNSFVCFAGNIHFLPTFLFGNLGSKKNFSCIVFQHIFVFLIKSSVSQKSNSLSSLFKCFSS